MHIQQVRSQEMKLLTLTSLSYHLDFCPVLVFGTKSDTLSIPWIKYNWQHFKFAVGNMSRSILCIDVTQSTCIAWKWSQSLSQYIYFTVP